MRLRRVWNYTLGGYTYDGVTLTKCQCNTSGGGCKCGHFEEDKAKELARRESLARQSRAETVQTSYETVPGSSLDTTFDVSRQGRRRVVSRLQEAARV